MAARPYEALLVARPNLEAEQVESLIERITQLIAANGGQVTQLDRWGRRRLAYDIQGFSEGTYVMMNYLGEPRTTHELERVLGITDEVMRHLIVQDLLPKKQPVAPAATAEEQPKQTAEEQAKQSAEQGDPDREADQGPGA